jgi:thiosulfate reductase / polysulfide reductase chain A
MENIYTVCGMCTVRCPAMASVKNDQILPLQGNPHLPAMARIWPAFTLGVPLRYSRACGKPLPTI